MPLIRLDRAARHVHPSAMSGTESSRFKRIWLLAAAIAALLAAAHGLRFTNRIRVTFGASSIEVRVHDNILSTARTFSSTREVTASFNRTMTSETRIVQSRCSVKPWRSTLGLPWPGAALRLSFASAGYPDRKRFTRWSRPSSIAIGCRTLND